MSAKDKLTEYRINEAKNSIDDYRAILASMNDDPNILVASEENSIERILNWASNTHEESSNAEDAAPDDNGYNTAVSDALSNLNKLVGAGSKILERNESRKRK